MLSPISATSHLHSSPARKPLAVDTARIIRPAPGGESQLSLIPFPHESLDSLFLRLEHALDEMDASLVQLIVFGSITAHAAAMEAMQQVFGHCDFPVTWVEGTSCDGHPIAGVQAFAFNGGAVDRIELHGRVIGSSFEYGGARHCVLGGLSPSKCSSRGDQTKQTLEQLQLGLAQAGFGLADVARTWFYLDDILSWYDEFNRARTEVYSNVKFTSGSLPASTGIGAPNPSRTALVVAARAMQSRSSSAHVREIASPLQCPAPAYGSSFSRAVELATTAGSQLWISGTASIAPAGETLWRDDTRKQIELTIDVVEAILRSHGMGFADVARATAYFKNRADAPLLSEWCAARGLRNLPVVPSECTICRDDLLFELEADACAANR